jgi:hypothetical protein
MLQLLGGTLAVAVSSQAVVPGANVSATAEERSADAVGERQYRGTATTTLGTGTFATGSASIRHDVEVTVTPPAGDGVATPFEVSLAGVGDRAVAAGPGRLVTAETTLDAAGREHIDRYWDVQAGADGAFSGILRTPSGEANVLSSQRALIPGDENTMLLVTEAMTGGTLLEGTITPTRIDFHVTGNTVNRFAADLLDNSRPFETDVAATRVNQ